jgi:hypothetical protein
VSRAGAIERLPVSPRLEPAPLSPLVEAVVLPCLFLTVVLAGAIRPGGDVTMVPPSLASLVLAVLLLSILARSGALAPERLVGPPRTPLQNASGIAVLWRPSRRRRRSSRWFFRSRASRS